MPYATAQDIIDRYGEDLLLQIADRDHDGEVDAVAVERAGNDADAEINTYLAARYVLPLGVVPEVLKRLAADIMVYRLASTADVATEEQRVRYEDAIKLLLQISKGVVSLGLPTNETPPSSNGVVFVAGPVKRFGRGRMP